MAADCSEPPVERNPDQPPEAKQEEALVETQDKETELPLGTLIGPSEPLAFRSTDDWGWVGVPVTEKV